MAIRRNLGTVKQACDIAGVTPGTIRNWLRQGLISAVRVGNGAFQYDLDQVAAMRVEYPCATTDEVIRGLVDAAPEFTPSAAQQDPAAVARCRAGKPRRVSAELFGVGPRPMSSAATTPQQTPIRIPPGDRRSGAAHRVRQPARRGIP
jgi:excisionase family DNA binding protein